MAASYARIHARVMNRLHADPAADEADSDLDPAAPPLSGNPLGMASNAFAEAIQPLMALAMKYGVSCDIRVHREDVTLASVGIRGRG